MSLTTYLLLAAAAVCCFSTLHAFPMDGFDTNDSCQCFKTRRTIIPLRQFQRLEIVPPGAHCRKTEILVTKKDNQTVCIDPEAPWIKNVLSKVISRKAVKETAVPTAA